MKKNPLRRSTKNISLQQQAKQQLYMAIGFYMVLGIVALTGKINWVVVAWYLLMGGVTYWVYAKDKRAAKLGKWRTPEASLHLLSVLGGWVGRC